MSLTDRLAARRTDAPLANRGCKTCQWLATRTAEEQADIAAWLDAGLSMTPLHEECVTEGLPVGQSAFVGHVRKCNWRPA